MDTPPASTPPTALHEQELSTAISAARFLYVFRWGLVAFMAVAAVILFSTLLLRRDLLVPCAGTVLALVLYNFIVGLRLREMGPRTTHEVRRLLATGLAADTMALALFLAFTGGVRNPLLALLAVPAVLGAFLLEGTPARLFPAFVSACALALYPARHLQTMAGDLYLTELAPVIALGITVLVAGALVSWLGGELRGAREALFRLRENENRADHLSAVGALLAELAHRLATPINAVRIRAERIVRRSPDDTDGQALLQGISAAEKALRETVSFPISAEDLRLREVELAGLVESLVGRWRGTNAGLRITMAPTVCVLARVPPLILGQSLYNLLGNALQAGASAVTVDVRGEGDMAAIEIRDDGPGFPETVLRDPGAPFLTTRAEGTGLGLHGCRDLCEALGGRLEIGNLHPRGAVARLVVPRIGSAA